mgnify:CR=1 FL=1
MNNTSSPSSTDAPRVAKPRKSYHTPRMEDYGAVNELTRSGPPTPPYTSDGGIGYTSGT